MLLTLLSMLGGGIMRLLPEVFSLLNKKTDNSHELAMLDRQVELEKTRSALRLEEIKTQGQMDQELAYVDSLKTALSSQMQKTGIKFVDGLNFLVRPVVTYYLLLMYGIQKIALYISSTSNGVKVWDAVLQVYTPEDFALLSGVISFWFVGRVFEKK